MAYGSDILSFFQLIRSFPLKHHLLATASAVVAGMAFLVGGQALAAPVTSFTPAQRAEIVGIMRDALQNDPSILTDAIRSIREKAEEQKQDSTLAAVKAHQSELQSAPDFAIRGNPHGKVTVVEFYDPRCSYCRSMMGEVDRFLSRHPDVRLVEKVVPVLGSNSVLDTRAIFAASAQGKYDVMRKALMEDTTKPSMERIVALAQANGLDAKKLTADMSSPQTVALITTNLDQGRAVGLDGTPTFIFGTAAVAPGALEADQMDAFLERARKA
ncbi:thioredoxin domain-containing protein [Gluconobacter sp. Dm-74]|nr:thioredoxin domain-containing protein [Gluconobacter sp. Dm-74]